MQIGVFYMLVFIRLFVIQIAITCFIQIECNAQVDDFGQLAEKIKSCRDKIQSFDVEISRITQIKKSAFMTLESCRMIVDRDMEIFFLERSEKTLDSKKMRAGIDPSINNRMEGKVERLLDTPEGLMKQIVPEPPRLVEKRLDPKKMDPLAFGLGVFGDLDSKRSHDEILAGLRKWPSPRLSTESGIIDCNFGNLKYRFDGSRDFWPIYHEYVTYDAPRKVKLQSRCELQLSNELGVWLPVSIQLETDQEMVNYELKWASVNRGVEDKYLSPARFAADAKMSLVTIDHLGRVHTVE